MRSHKRLVVVITALLCLILGGTAVAWSSSWGPFAASPAPSQGPTASTPPSPEPAPTPTATATTSAPTTVEPDEPTDEPTDVPTTAHPSPTPSPAVTLSAATVVITYASWAPETTAVEVGAYAAVVEGAGSCTLTLRKGEVVRSQTLDALEDVSTTSCGGFLIPGSDLSTGTWSAVVSYTSAQSAGQSNPVEVTVP